MMQCNWLLAVVMILAAWASAADGPPVNLRRTVTVEVVEKTKGAVVNVSAKKLVSRQRQAMVSPFMPPMAFGPVVQVLRADSLGSGFIIHPDGYVVTNNHVVDQALGISVELADGRKLPAELISTDPDADLALLRIHSDGTPLPTVEPGGFGKRFDDWGAGDRGGESDGWDIKPQRESTGIVSSRCIVILILVGRISRVFRCQRGKMRALRDLIQTDAWQINPGNSGGPLLNAYGQSDWNEHGDSGGCAEYWGLRDSDRSFARSDS